MKSLLKKIFYRYMFTHKLFDATYNLFSKTIFNCRWKLMGKYQTLTMRTKDEYRIGLENLIHDLPANLIMVEIGSYRGESTNIFLSSGKIQKIYCVDPWKPFYDKSDIAAFTDMAKVESDFDEKFKNDPRVLKEKGTIDDFIQKKQLQQIDFVYIDGCHTEDATYHDISMSIEHLKPKFAIAGHDYNTFSGVTAAVNKFFGAPDKTYKDTSWVKFLSTPHS